MNLDDSFSNMVQVKSLGVIFPPSELSQEVELELPSPDNLSSIPAQTLGIRSSLLYFYTRWQQQWFIIRKSKGSVCTHFVALRLFATGRKAM